MFLRGRLILVSFLSSLGHCIPDKPVGLGGCGKGLGFFTGPEFDHGGKIEIPGCQVFKGLAERDGALAEGDGAQIPRQGIFDMQGGDVPPGKF
jgi:hypothetical protein